MEILEWENQHCRAREQILVRRITDLFGELRINFLVSSNVMFLKAASSLTFLWNKYIGH